PRHADAAATFESVRGRLGVMFRALGGSGGVQLAAAAATASGHRLGLRQRLGLGVEKIDRATLDGATLQLPPELALFPSRADNEALYEWLMAWFAAAALAEEEGAPET